MSVASGTVTLVPFSIGAAVALTLLPFPAADRLLGLSLIATMPLIWSAALPNLPLAAAVLVIGLVRVARIELRDIRPRAWIILAAMWAPLLLGIALAHWPPASIWLRPAALLGFGGVAAALGLLVWRNSERRRRWMEGITLGLLITSVSGLVVFALQSVLSTTAIVDGFADLQGVLRGTSAGETFREQNNWLIPGERVTLRAISPLFPSPNNLGAYLGITTPIAFIGSLSHPKRAWRLVAVAATVLAVALAVLTFSRSTWLATAVAGVLMVGLVAYGEPSRRGMRPPALRLAAALLFVALVALWVGAAAGSTTVIDRLVNPLADESVTDRLDTNQQAIDRVITSPLRGAGLGNWRAAIEGQDDVAYIHNVYLEYTTSLGIFGGLWAVLLVAVPLVAGATMLTPRSESFDPLLGVVVVAVFAFAAVHFLFDDNLLNPQYAWLLSFASGGGLGAAWARRGDVSTIRTA
jgi:hypothetical protein